MLWVPTASVEVVYFAAYARVRRFQGLCLWFVHESDRADESAVVTMSLIHYLRDRARTWLERGISSIGCFDGVRLRRQRGSREHSHATGRSTRSDRRAVIVERHEFAIRDSSVDGRYGRRERHGLPDEGGRP